MKKINPIAFILGSTVIVLALAVPSATSDLNVPYEPISGQSAQTEIKLAVAEKQEVAKITVSLDPALYPVCTCESGQGTGKPQHYNVKTGEVLHGEQNPRDIGLCQINLDYHQETAEKMGLNVFLENDNITYANWLYKQQGLQPWAWSQKCWSK